MNYLISTQSHADSVEMHYSDHLTKEQLLMNLKRNVGDCSFVIADLESGIQERYVDFAGRQFTVEIV